MALLEERCCSNLRCCHHPLFGGLVPSLHVVGEDNLALLRFQLVHEVVELAPRRQVGEVGLGCDVGEPEARLCCEVERVEGVDQLGAVDPRSSKCFKWVQGA